MIVIELVDGNCCRPKIQLCSSFIIWSNKMVQFLRMRNSWLTMIDHAWLARITFQDRKKKSELCYALWQVSLRMFRRICQEKVSLKSSTWGIMNPFVVQLFLAASVKSFMTYPSTKNKNVAYKKYLRISLFLIWMRHLFLRGESRLLVIHNYIKLLRADCVASVEITENG